MNKGEWIFLSNHGQVFAYVTKEPESTIQVIAQATNLSVAGVQKILLDLEKSGYIAKIKVGRHNRYEICPELSVRPRSEKEHSVGYLLAGLGYYTLAPIKERAKWN
jgi:DNA-binding MarR family transcriptional regulator